MWERRYGFPLPQRTLTGQRLYPAEQVDKLRVIKRLLDCGMRPGGLLGQEIDALRRIAGTATTPGFPRAADAWNSQCLDAVLHRDVAVLRGLLRSALAREGLRSVVCERLPALNREVGLAWASGDITPAEEHLYTEAVESALRAAIEAVRLEARSPRVLLTTLPGERHKLGLVMLEAVLAAEQVDCLPLGTETPSSAIASMARDAAAEVVALSFSASYSRAAAFEQLVDLRHRLPATIHLWAGGEGLRAARKKIAGIKMPMTLENALFEVAQLRGGAAPA